ncbi:MAG TPA: TIGR01777 family oxidoreductase [Verrucomicrobiae bacterium]|nr:TIGR01777 family oxidoreductase [Verrucomicrobiae bacterium]
MKRRIILAGGSGFLGNALAGKFIASGHEVFILTRRPKNRNGVTEILWDAKSPGDWTKVVDGADVVINLTGKSVDCRYNKKNRREIISSRIDSTRILGEAISRSANPPRVWLNSSSATFYKHSLNRPMDEAGETGFTPEAKDEFSVEVIRQWENALNAAVTPRTRKVALRTAIVFARNGEAFRAFRTLARFGLGGAMVGGKQMVSWIHEMDFCRAIEYIIANDSFRGPVNVAAPNPLPNSEMMRCFRKSSGVPIGLPATKWMLEIGAFVLRTETELLIKSRYVVPGKLQDSGFQFKFLKFSDALADLCK